MHSKRETLTQKIVAHRRARTSVWHVYIACGMTRTTRIQQHVTHMYCVYKNTWRLSVVVYCKGPVRTIVWQLVVATRMTNELVWQQSGVTCGRCLRCEQKSFAYRKPSRLHGDSMGSPGSIASIFCLRSHTMVIKSPPGNALTMSRAARRWSCVGKHVCTWLQASP